MNQGQAMDLVWGLLALTLVGSSLIARRLPIGQVARLTVAWVAIFGVALLLISQRDSFARLWTDMRRDLLGQEQQVRGGIVRVPMSADGHFWVDARINGRSVRLLVDSGATTTAFSRATAQATGIAVDEAADPVIIATANGTVGAQRARVERLEVGGIVASDLPVVVAAAFGDTNVLGMNFLSRLRAWRVEGRTLLLDGGTSRELT